MIRCIEVGGWDSTLKISVHLMHIFFQMCVKLESTHGELKINTVLFDIVNFSHCGILSIFYIVGFCSVGLYIITIINDVQWDYVCIPNKQDKTKKFG